MRTTLTLDPDVAVLVERQRRETGAHLKDIINEALRRGLSAEPGATSARRTYTLVRDQMKPRLPTIDDIAGVLDFVEGPEHK